MVELTSYIKGIASMMEKVDTLVTDSVWESIHSQVQEFVQNRLSAMQKTSLRKILHGMMPLMLCLSLDLLKIRILFRDSTK